MQTKEENSNQAREFFDNHAKVYRSKYEKRDNFYDYFFYERLEKATDGLKVEGKAILDIGAGTGPLYDFLAASGLNGFKTYEATDISAGMLAQSNIPKADQRIGDFTQMEFDDSYDLIFMLGVSTYLSADQMKDHLRKVVEILNPGGVFIVTFTHSQSVDIFMRKLLSPIAKLFSGDDRIISQQFKTKYYSRKEIESLMADPIQIVAIEGLNHTFFPFSRIFKKPSIRFAKQIARRKESNFKRLMSSDLLVKISR